MRWLALCLVLVAGDAAGVGAFVTGNKLLGWCKAGERADAATASETDWMEASKCRAYTQAVHDDYATWRDADIIPGDYYCLPNGVIVSQLERIVVKYLEARPEELHMAASGLVVLAYMEAFPCN